MSDKQQRDQQWSVTSIAMVLGIIGVFAIVGSLIYSATSSKSIFGMFSRSSDTGIWGSIKSTFNSVLESFEEISLGWKIFMGILLVSLLGVAGAWWFKVGPFSPSVPETLVAPSTNKVVEKVAVTPPVDDVVKAPEVPQTPVQVAETPEVEAAPHHSWWRFWSRD